MPVFRSKWLKNHTLWGGTYLSLNWCKLWPIVTRPLAYQYIDRASTDTGRCIDRNLIGGLLVNYRWRIGHLSVLYQSIVERWSTDIYYPPLIKDHRPTHHRYFIDILSLLDRHTWKKSISYRFRNRRHVGISTANHASLLIITFHWHLYPRGSLWRGSPKQNNREIKMNATQTLLPTNVQHIHDHEISKIKQTNDLIKRKEGKKKRLTLQKIVIPKTCLIYSLI